MSKKDYFQQVPNATSFQILDHVAWNNNLMRIDYFNELANFSQQRIKLSFTQSIVSSSNEYLIVGSSYTAIEPNTDMWNGSYSILIPENGWYVITSQHTHNTSTTGRRTGVIRISGPSILRNWRRQYTNNNTFMPRAICTHMYLSKNDEISFYAQQNSGATQTVDGIISVTKIPLISNYWG